MSGPTRTTTLFPVAVDPPISIDATYRFSNQDRAYIDAQIRALQNAILKSRQCYGGIYTTKADSISLSLPSSGSFGVPGTPVQVTFPHVLAASANTTVASNAITATVGTPVLVMASVSFSAPSNSAEVDFQIYKNGSPITDPVTATLSSSGNYSVALPITLVITSSGDKFSLWAYEIGSGTGNITIETAELVLMTAAASVGPQGPAGAPGATGATGAGGFGGATGTPLTGAVNAIGTGNTIKGVDCSGAPVGAQIGDGALDGETKSFIIVAGTVTTNTLTITCTTGNKIVSRSNGGISEGFLEIDGIAGTLVVLTWVAALNSWVTAS